MASLTNTVCLRAALKALTYKKLLLYYCSQRWILWHTESVSDAQAELMQRKKQMQGCHQEVSATAIAQLEITLSKRDDRGAVLTC